MRQVRNIGRTRQFAMIAALFALTLALGCSKRADPSDSKAVEARAIYTVNYPLSYFAKRMAPTDVPVVFPVPQGIDPAFWKPSAGAVREYQAAGLIVQNGAGYAGWTRYATLPQAQIVVTANGCRDGYLRTEQSIRHQHGPEGAHAHGDFAFTTWLDLRLAACQARRIRDALIERMPNERDGIAERFEALERDLLDLDARLQSVGERLGEQPFLASHPVYPYFADAYGLSIQSLHLEPDEVLTEDDWKEIDEALEQSRAKWMLWEAPPLEATEAGLLKRGVTPIVFDPVANVPSEGDFLSVMEANVERLGCAAGVKPCR